MRGVILLLLAAATSVAAQSPTPAPASSDQTPVKDQARIKQMTVPAGTQVLLQLKSPIDTKTARVGAAVYCQTSFPVTQDTVPVIPAAPPLKPPTPPMPPPRH